MFTAASSSDLSHFQSYVLGAARGNLVIRITDCNGGSEIVRVSATKCSIGSAESCTVRLTADGVHPVHCLILRGDERTVVRCWSEGTWLNGGEFSDSYLVAGDVLRIANLDVAIVSDDREGREGLVQEDQSPEELIRQLRHENAEYERRLTTEARQYQDDRERLRAENERLSAEIAQQSLQLDELSRHNEVFDPAQLATNKPNPQANETEEQHQELLRQCEEWKATLAAKEADWNRRESELKQPVADLEAQSEALTKEREQLQAQLDEQQAQIASRIGKLEAELQEKQAAWDAREAELQREAVKRDEQTQELEKQRLKLEAEARESVLTHQTAELEAKTRELEKQRENLEQQLQQQASEREAQLQEKLADWEACKAELKQHTAELEERTQELEQQRQTLESKLDQQATEREAQLQEKLADWEARKTELKQHTAELEERTQELEQQREYLETKLAEETAKQETQRQTQETEWSQREAEFQARIADAEEQISRFVADREQLQKVSAEPTQELAELEAQFEAKERNRNERERELQQQLTEYERQNEALSRQQEELQRQFEAREAEWQQYAAEIEKAQYADDQPEGHTSYDVEPHRDVSASDEPTSVDPEVLSLLENASLEAAEDDLHAAANLHDDAMSLGIEDSDNEDLGTDEHEETAVDSDLLEPDADVSWTDEQRLAEMDASESFLGEELVEEHPSELSDGDAYADEHQHLASELPAEESPLDDTFDAPPTSILESGEFGQENESVESQLDFREELDPTADFGFDEDEQFEAEELSFGGDPHALSQEPDPLNHEPATETDLLSQLQQSDQPVGCDTSLFAVDNEADDELEMPLPDASPAMTADDLEFQTPDSTAPVDTASVLAQFGTHVEEGDQPLDSSDASAEEATEPEPKKDESRLTTFEKTNLTAEYANKNTVDISDETSIENYMQQLLQRVGGSPEAESPSGKPGTGDPSAKLSTLGGTDADDGDDNADDEDAKKTLRRRPEPVTDLSALRALANESTRTAIDRHANTSQRTAALAHLGTTIIVALVGAIFIVLAHRELNVLMFCGLVTTGVAFYFAYSFFKAGLLAVLMGRPHSKTAPPSPEQTEEEPQDTESGSDETQAAVADTDLGNAQAAGPVAEQAVEPPPAAEPQAEPAAAPTPSNDLTAEPDSTLLPGFNNEPPRSLS